MEDSSPFLVVVHVDLVSDLAHAMEDCIWALPLHQQLIGGGREHLQDLICSLQLLISGIPVVLVFLGTLGLI